MYNMSSAGDDLPCFVVGGEMNKNRSKFIEEITSVPFIQSAATLYCTVKEKNRLIKLTLKPFESSCTKALGILHKALPSRLESSMDEKAAKCVSYAKRKYPKIKKTPREIYSDGRTKVVATVWNAAEALAKSKPGQTVIRGLDWSIEKGESLIEYLEENGPSESPERYCPRTKTQLEKGKESHYASSDSGVNSEMKERPSDLVRHRVQAPRKASTSEEKRVLRRSTSISFRVYRITVVLPVELLVAILRNIRCVLRQLRGTRAIRRNDTVVKDKPLTPEKVAEIESRRKVSPRKRIRRTFLGAIKSAAYGFVGQRTGNIFPEPSSAIKDKSVSPKNTEGEKKRKFHETETEKGSDDSESEKGFKDLDLTNYKSDEDPDYVPSEESEDSLEYKLSEADEVETTDDEKKEKDEEGKLKEGKTKEGKTKEGKTREGKTREGKTREGKTREGKTREGKTREERTREERTKERETRERETREERTREERTREGETREGETKEERTREGETSEGKTREGKTREEKKEEDEEEEEKTKEPEEAEEEDTEEVNANFGKETLGPGVLEMKSDTEHVVGHDKRDDEAEKGTDDDMVDISLENVDNSQPQINSPVIRLAPSWKVE